MSLYKKKSLFNFLIILFSVYPVFSQNFKMGTLHKGSGKYDPFIKNEDENNLYVVAENAYGDYSIEAYSKKNDLKRLYSEPLKHEKINKKHSVSVEAMTHMGERFVIFYSYLDSKTKEYTLFAKLFDKNTGKPIGQRKDIYTIPVEKKSRKGDFTIKVSEKKTRIFIKHSAYYKTLKKDITQFTLLNPDLEVLFEYKLDNDEKLPGGYIVDNDGSIYYLRYRDMNLYVGSYDANKDYEKWEEKINFDYASLDKFYLHNLEFNIKRNNDFTITGLVSKKDEKNNVKVYGSVFVAIDNESKEQKVAKINEFPADLFDQFRTKKDIKKERSGTIVNNFGREEVLDKEDGGVIMTMESYYKVSYYTNGAISGKTIEYSDILILNFDEQGNMLWSNRIPKRQYFSWNDLLGGIFITSSRGLHILSTPVEWKTTRYFSYSIGIVNDKLHIYHNDLLKNFEEKGLTDKYKKFKKPRTAVVVKHEFDLVSGTRSKDLFTSWSEKGIKLCPGKGFQKNEESDLFLFGIKGRKYAFARVSK